MASTASLIIAIVACGIDYCILGLIYAAHKNVIRLYSAPRITKHITYPDIFPFITLGTFNITALLLLSIMSMTSMVTQGTLIHFWVTETITTIFCITILCWQNHSQISHSKFLSDQYTVTFIFSFGMYLLFLYNLVLSIIDVGIVSVILSVISVCLLSACVFAHFTVNGLLIEKKRRAIASAGQRKISNARGSNAAQQAELMPPISKVGALNNGSSQRTVPVATMPWAEIQKYWTLMIRASKMSAAWAIIHLPLICLCIAQTYQSGTYNSSYDIVHSYMAVGTMFYFVVIISGVPSYSNYVYSWVARIFIGGQLPVSTGGGGVAVVVVTGDENRMNPQRMSRMDRIQE